MRSIVLLSMLLSSVAFAFTPPRVPRAPSKPAAPVEEPREVKRGRLDIDKPMNVTGQRPGINAVELYDRKLLTTTSMVKTRQNFRDSLYEER